MSVAKVKLLLATLKSLVDPSGKRMSQLAIRRIGETVRRDPEDPIPDPRRLADAVGATSVVSGVAGCGGVGVVAGTILFRPSPDRRVWGLRVYHGIAHYLLAKTTCSYCEIDIDLLTIELVAPTKYLRSPCLDLLEISQQYAPSELVAQIIRNEYERRLAAAQTASSGVRRVRQKAG